MRKSFIPLLLTLCVLYASPSFAFEGRYRAGSKAYRQDMTIKKQGADSYNVDFVVGTEGCSGNFEGTGHVQGTTLVAQTPPPAEPDDKCVVSISRKGAKLEVTEEGCDYWHGASCGFEGTYRKR